MLNYVSAELIKQKRSFNQKVIWMVPLVLAILGFGIMGSTYAFSGAYNWWYILFLPVSMTYIAVTLITKDQGKNYHGLMGVAEDKRKIWCAKIIVGTLYVLAINMIFFSMMVIGSKILGLYVMDIKKAFLGSLLLFVTFAWQIPLFMFIGQKMGVFLSVLVSIFCNMGIACICAVEYYWWIPFAIPARLMCPTIGVLPNGLLVTEAGKRFADGGVIVPGILITITLYGVGAWLTTYRFSKREV